MCSHAQFCVFFSTVMKNKLYFQTFTSSKLTLVKIFFHFLQQHARFPSLVSPSIVLVSVGNAASQYIITLHRSHCSLSVSIVKLFFITTFRCFIQNDMHCSWGEAVSENYPLLHRALRDLHFAIIFFRILLLLQF